MAFRALGKLGLRSRSEPHLSHRDNPPSAAARPLWIFGFARTGTTTAQSMISTEFEYNACFEPFGIQEATALSILEGHRLFLGSPRSEEWSEYVRNGGVNAALSTFGDSKDGRARRAVFEAAIDCIYSSYGRNTVVKEIRLFANCDAVARYHDSRGIPWCCVGIVAHPFQPLYTYYRIGGLCAAPYNKLEPESLYRYRMQTYERLDRHAELRSLPARSPAEKLVVACLLDQANLSSFFAERCRGGVLSTLPELPSRLEEIGTCLDRVPLGCHSLSIRPSDRYAQDPLFRRLVLDRLAPEIHAAVAASWGRTAGLERSRAAFRERMTSLRHRFFA